MEYQTKNTLTMSTICNKNSFVHRLIAMLSDDLHFNDFENLKQRIINYL